MEKPKEIQHEEENPKIILPDNFGNFNEEEMKKFSIEESSKAVKEEVSSLVKPKVERVTHFNNWIKRQLTRKEWRTKKVKNKQAKKSRRKNRK